MSRTKGSKNKNTLIKEKYANSLLEQFAMLNSIIILEPRFLKDKNFKKMVENLMGIRKRADKSALERLN